MPFNVLKCFECATFQIHPQTKSKKWRCKLCNEKQSFVKVYMVGSAPDCRKTVQDLNMRRGESDSCVEWSAQDLLSETRERLLSPIEDHQLNRLTQTQNTWNGFDRVEVRGNCLTREAAQHRDLPPTFFESTAEPEHMSDQRGSKWSKYLDTVEDSASSSDEEISTVNSNEGFRSHIHKK